ncbi:hypothetical protein CR513_22090, partial [Mucuna pruriens]
MPPQGNSPSLEDLMKQLATSNLEFQQTMSSIEYKRHYSGPQDANQTASQYYEPFTVGWIQQLTLTNNSKPEREYECTYFEK